MSIDCRRTSELLGAHADGGLDPAAAVEVERHVEGCAACAGELRAIRALVGELHRLPAGPIRSEASWGDFSRQVRLAWQRSQEEQAGVAEALRRRLRRILFGAGAALALGTAALLLVPRLAGPRRASDSTARPIAGAASRPSIPAPANAPLPPPAVPRDKPESLDERDGARLEAAGRLGDLLGDPDPDELLDDLDDEQLERVGAALTPGA